MTNGTRKGLGDSVTSRPLFTPRKDSVPIVQEAEWAPGSVWTGAENLAPTEIRSPDRPTRSSVAIPTELSRPTNDEDLFLLNKGRIRISKQENKYGNKMH
jgi:hypothetical protein